MFMLVLFGIFICVLINSFLYFSPTKFMSWLYSLLPKPPPSTTPTPPPPLIKKKSSMDKDELAMVFSTFDKNGDGFITKQELQQSLENLGMFVSDEQITTMVEKVDANGDGLIDVNEFCELYESIDRGEGGDGGGEGDDLREAFNVFDENGDGLITVEELGLVLSSLGLKRGLGDCKNMIKNVDMDGDGMVNFEEFKRMMQSGRLITIS
ncbi:calmodulin-like protein 3 [Cinnamomum micranthum f. kanehirae]|uniref:Calmodulin-like protein 3 n=1 Tax=Cinnamomum micranthum f. kanehirae TaxID=337451 RepID=A0A3S3NUW9_9MAGN|nr:calmodulin-like protein 3 [Cinnamomum micranthum f. kanehirae]